MAENAGSVASAGYVALAELLRRGLEVDLFAHRDHVREPASLRDSPLTYRGFDQPAWLAAIDRLPGRAPLVARRLLYPAAMASWRRVLEPAAAEVHRSSPYDALLVLGTLPAFGVPGVPVVTWLQGPFHTELEALRRLRPQIEATVGRPLYMAVTAWYRSYEYFQRHNAVRSDRFVVPSEWSRRAMLEREGPQPPIDVVPYPVDLERFSPYPAVEIDHQRPLLLSLGRVDPRKRPDLLVDAFHLVRREVPGARLLVVGSPGLLPNQLSVLEGVEGVEYRPAVSRTAVPDLVREAAVVVQPSENENFGSTVAEALACGTPVVVGPTNGTSAYADRHSHVFDWYSADAVAHGILEVLRHRSEHPDEVRATTRASAEHFFSAATVGGKLLDSIERAADEYSKKRGSTVAATLPRRSAR